MTRQFIVTLQHDTGRTRTAIYPGSEAPDATRAAWATVPAALRSRGMVQTFREIEP